MKKALITTAALTAAGLFTLRGRSNHPGMEAVFLCNFFHDHAPFAIKALERNIHVLSECTSNGTMAEGVALVRAAKKSITELLHFIFFIFCYPLYYLFS